MKKLGRMMMMLSLASIFTACGNAPGKQELATPAPTTSPAEEIVFEDKLVVYSTHPEDLLEFVATEFEKESGVKVEFINLKGELQEKVLAEKDNPQADIMYGGASSIFLDLQQQDAFERVQTSWASELDPMFKDKEGYWYGTIQTPVMMFYNKEMLNEETAPKDWSDLVKPAFKDQLVFRGGGSSSAKAMYSSLLYQFDKDEKLEDGWKFMQELDVNTKKYYSSGSLQFQAVGRKEASVSFAVLSAIMDNKNNGLPLEIVNATSGSPVITDGVAMLKNAKHPNSAQFFVEFVGSKDMQAKLANEFDRMPTLKSALEASPTWMSEMEYKVMDVDWKALSEKQSEWMQKWDSEIKDNSKQQD